MAACIVAADAQDKDCLQALNMVPGWEDDQSPYRSELTGVVGSLALLLVVVGVLISSWVPLPWHLMGTLL
jgi:hypothetical protein